jgi:glycosyltransferase involved in cell wall biosynthesis
VKVLYFADTRFPIERANGLQTMATCHALAARGHEVTLVVRPDSEGRNRDPFAFYGLPPVSGLEIRTVAAGEAGRTRRVRFLLGAVRQAATSQGAVVLTRDLGLAAWVSQLPTARRPPLVYESHGLADVVAAEMPAMLGGTESPSPTKLARLAKREARVWSRASAYVTITSALADELNARFGGRTRVFVVPDAARPVEAGALPPPDPTVFVAGYAGHLYPWKGVDVFVRALALAPDVRGLIVGGHPGERDLARVTRLARDLGVNDRLTVTGLVPPADVARRLAPASVLVLPNTASAISERYTSPLKLFEYLGLGRPIVASNLASIREVLTDQETALLVPPGDETALAAALTELRTNPALAAALGSSARRLASGYTWEARAARLEAALEAARVS